MKETMCDVCGLDYSECDCKPWPADGVLRDLRNQEPPDHLTDEAKVGFKEGMNYAIGMVRLILPKAKR